MTPPPPHDDDVRAIEALIRRQFASLQWDAGTDADWDGFRADFLPEAPLLPAKRPVQPCTTAAFVERMKGLAGGSLRALQERLRGCDIRVFGNVAVALAVCELTENHTETSRNVEAMLLVKTDGAWRIAAQAWDTESADKIIPPALLDPAAP